MENFAIIANNCWGMYIYKQLKIQYTSPFINLFIMPECYLKILNNLRWYLKQPITFINKSKYRWVNKSRSRNRREGNYPIGLLHDAEIQFLHFKTNEEVLDKWYQRIQRIPNNDDRIFIKFCDYYGCTLEQLYEFNRIPFRHKVCFVSQPRPEVPCAIWVEGGVKHGGELHKVTSKYFDINKWINDPLPNKKFIIERATKINFSLVTVK